MSSLVAGANLFPNWYGKASTTQFNGRFATLQHLDARYQSDLKALLAKDMLKGESAIPTYISDTRRLYPALENASAKHQAARFQFGGIIIT